MHSHASHQLTKAAAVVIEVRHYLERRRQHVKHLLLKFGDICHIPHISSGAYTARSVSLLSHTPRLPSQSHTPTPLSRILGNMPHLCVAGHCGSYLWSQAFRFGRGQKQRGKRRGHRFVFILESNCHASCFLDILLNPLPLAMLLFLTLLTCFFFSWLDDRWHCTCAWNCYCTNN